MNEELENKMEFYPIATTIGAEKRVLSEIDARLSDFGSLKGLRNEIGGTMSAPHVRGYIIVESTAKHHVEKIMGLNKLNHTSRMKGVKYILDAMDAAAVKVWMRERSPLEGITIGSLVEIIKGAFKGEQAIVRNVIETQGLATLELLEGAIPMSIKMSGKEIRNIDSN
jgi:transcription elongation factor Spt5|tara:strand:- start:19538 stop:20041 length:504 start_codon:yes stop_codon:yes gene_type:complete